MSTTVELLVRAIERYARLRAAVEQLAADVEAARDDRVAWVEADSLDRVAKRLRALLAAVDS